MKICSVQAFGVWGVPDGAYNFGRGPHDAHDHVLITGGAASGKTRLLELIAAVREVLAPSDEEGFEEGSMRRPGNQTARAIVRFVLTDAEQATIGALEPTVQAEVIFNSDAAEAPDAGLVFLLQRYSHEDATPKLEYFDEHRRLDVGGGDVDLSESRQKRFRSRSSPRKFAFVPGFLAALPSRREQAVRFAASLSGLSPSCRYDLERASLSSHDRALRSLGELSASEADAVIFAATATLVGLSNSIVLVDTPELYGLEAVSAFRGICSLGSANQVIVATSSTSLIAGFQGAVVRLTTTGGRL